MGLKFHVTWACGDVMKISKFTLDVVSDICIGLVCNQRPLHCAMFEITILWYNVSRNYGPRMYELRNILRTHIEVHCGKPLLFKSPPISGPITFKPPFSN
ncbi:hypothetical protein CBL_13942 [Carabus blaptoides fortunei]